MIYPKKLVKNSVIEIISPSNGVKSKKIEKYENAINNLSKNKKNNKHTLETYFE